MEKPIANSLPTSAGVYLYKDKHELVIYVGKARNIRARLLSYFRKDISVKTSAMLRQAFSIDTISTSTEKEALLLEASLIKKYRPRYNIVLRDDKSYVLFKLNLGEKFPRLEIVRSTSRKKNDKAKYFGPYVSTQAARLTYKLIHNIFILRRCKDRAFKNRIKPCLYYHMAKCKAPCMGLINSIEYHDNMKSVIKLLDGRTDDLLLSLRSQMLEASDILNFESAAILRDQIKVLESTLEHQSVILPKMVNLDAIGLHRSDKGLALSVLFIRSGSLNGARSFFWSGLDWEDAPELLYTFLSQFYVTINPPPRVILPWLPHSPINLGNEAKGLSDDKGRKNRDIILDNKVDAKGANEASIILDRDTTTDAAATTTTAAGDIILDKNISTIDKESLSFLESTLSELANYKVRITLAHSVDENRLIDMASENSKQESNLNNDMPMPMRLAKVLHLENPANRIECVDVSHTSGQQTRVGMVVFEDSKPLTSAYRQYAMPDGNDDYACLAAWVLRRLESGPPWPDLLLIDGGKGQLSAVQNALTKAGHPDLFPLAAIAKARNLEGRPDRRAGNINDRIFLPNRSNPLPLGEGCAELLFLQLVRDSTHNFAIGRHRQARNSAALSGELLRIPGIGAKTARLLWNHFENIQAMREASLEQLSEIAGIGKNRAVSILNKLRSGI